MIKLYSTIACLVMVVFALVSCTSNKSSKKDTATTYQANDSLRYRHLKEQFYTDKSGKLFEQKYFAIKGKGDVFDSQIYYDSVAIFNMGDSVIEKPLSEIIDINTFTKLDNGTQFSKDKNYVYYSSVSTSGSYRVIVNGANPNSFRPLSDYRYGMDDKHIFCKSKMINGLNFKKHEILYSSDTTDYFIDYVKDDKIVFYEGDTVKGADAKTFKLVVGQKWSAEDKNYKYECCGQRLE